jgi:AI-2 transport protein TqsA
MAFVVGGWPLALAVVAVYCVVNVVLQVLVQPKFVADAVNLSLTLSFVSVVFWTFVIGPLGAILAIPLTLLVRALLLEGDPHSGWLRWLSGDDVAAGAVTTTTPTPDDGSPRAAEPLDGSPDESPEETAREAAPGLVATAEHTAPDGAGSAPADPGRGDGAAETS